MNDGPRLAGCADETKQTILAEIDRAEEAAASSLAVDPETGEKDEEMEEQFLAITRTMADLLRGQLFGKEAIKGQRENHTTGDGQ